MSHIEGSAIALFAAFMILRVTMFRRRWLLPAIVLAVLGAVAATVLILRPALP